jgi:hypothetical protein
MHPSGEEISKMTHDESVKWAKSVLRYSITLQEDIEKLAMRMKDNWREDLKNCFLKEK